MKIGDKARGFRFGSKEKGDSTIFDELKWPVKYYPLMDQFVGVEGEILFIDDDSFIVKFPQSDLGVDGNIWWYPIAEYLRIQREERLKEIGI